jgi:hypothetical protein
MLHATQLVLVQQGTYYGVLTCSCNRIHKYEQSVQQTFRSNDHLREDI